MNNYEEKFLSDWRKPTDDELEEIAELQAEHKVCWKDTVTFRVARIVRWNTKTKEVFTFKVFECDECGFEFFTDNYTVTQNEFFIVKSMERTLQYIRDYRKDDLNKRLLNDLEAKLKIQIINILTNISNFDHMRNYPAYNETNRDLIKGGFE